MIRICFGSSINLDEGLRKELAGDDSVKLIHDYMDVRRNIMPEYPQHLYELYRTKYSQKHFDAVVAVDDAAYQFVQNYRQELFRGAAILPESNDVESVRALRSGDSVTGVVENIDLRGTLGNFSGPAGNQAHCGYPGY